MSNEQLVELIRAGVDVADHMLALYNNLSGLIGRIAWDYRGKEDVEDLRQEGYIALYRAVDHYRPETGQDFARYAAYWIRAGIRRYIDSAGRTVRIPSGQMERISKYKRAVAEFAAVYGYQPDDQALAYWLGISVSALYQLRVDVMMETVGSLDIPVNDETDTTLGELQATGGDLIGDLIDDVAASELKAALWDTVASLPDQQRAVIEARYRDGLTLKETAARIGVNGVEGIRMHERKALKALGHGKRGDRLRPYLDVYNMALHGVGAGTFNRTWTSSTERAAIKLFDCADKQKQPDDPRRSGDN